MKKYTAIICITVEAESEIEALESVESYLALGVEPTGVSVREIES
jgi:hypothetical protein